MLALLSGCAGLSIEELSELAERGDVDATYDLANAYYAGKHGVSRDHRQAQLWFEKAHRQGHPCAATYVGRIYDEGKFGVQPDQEKALAWYRSGMEAGDKNAYLILGLKQLDGKAERPDYQDTAMLLDVGLKRPGEKGCQVASRYKSPAMFYLAMMYAEGRGDLERKGDTYALSLLEQSRNERQYMSYSSERWGNTIYNTTTTHTPALPVEWIRAAAKDHGFALAFFMLGVAYEKGNYDLEQDDSEAYVWYAMAAASGFPDAQIARLRIWLDLDWMQRIDTNIEIQNRLKAYRPAG